MSKTRSSQGQRPSRSELRASIVWPVVISVGIWVAGLLIYIFLPGRFDVPSPFSSPWGWSSICSTTSAPNG